MSAQQILLRFLYHFIMFIDKLMPAKDACLLNVNHQLPITPVYNVAVIPNNGLAPITLEKYKGKKILIVNTASNCGYTAQYQELEELSTIYTEKLIIIAFPSNNFMGQEPKDDSSIAKFCKLNYGVSFPIMKKSDVLKTNNQNEIYKWLTDSSKNGWCNKVPTWNFCKYLINEDGVLTHFFKQGVSPLNKKIIKAIEDK